MNSVLYMWEGAAANIDAAHQLEHRGLGSLNCLCTSPWTKKSCSILNIIFTIFKVPLSMAQCDYTT